MRSCSNILLHGSGEHCSRPCRAQYCYTHKAHIKKSQKITTFVHNVKSLHCQYIIYVQNVKKI